MIEKLIKLAVFRANLAGGVRTARAVGDTEWAAEAEEDINRLDNEISALKSQMSERDIAEARDRTNAPI